MAFRIVLALALALALVAAAVLTFFFLWELADGSLYGDAGFVLLFVLLAWGLVAAALALRRRDRAGLGIAVLMPVIFPSVMYGLIILVFMLSGESWR